MARYRIDMIASLARQLAFAPVAVRSAQLAAAEDLLLEVDPAKGYPTDWVTFRITAYRPKAAPTDLLAGSAVQHDLGLLIEQTSETLNTRTASLAEPVLQIEDVCQRFNVTSKTIQRWRRRGLPARKFYFPDGKRRVGFLLSRVERFIQLHQPQVQRAGDFSQVSCDERDLMVRRARRLATMCNCCVPEITRRVARKHGRSPLTVLHTLRKHDAEHPDTAVFHAAAPPVGSVERAQILQSYRRGLGLRQISSRACRPRSAVYRVILEERLDRILNRRIRFIDDPLYHQKGAGSVVKSIVAAAASAVDAPDPETSRPYRTPPGELGSLFAAPLLTSAMERALFLKLNYHKYRFVSARKRLDPERIRNRNVELTARHLRRATRVKNRIVKSNLRLVANVARKHLRPGLTIDELISDGALTLMRAVDGFDLHRGTRFSTYATLALMKGFARSVPQMLAKRQASGQTEFDRFADKKSPEVGDRLAQVEQVQQLLGRLDAGERDVLEARFGLDQPGEACTTEQIGRRLGLSVARVRQIERQAMDKLRTSANGS